MQPLELLAYASIIALVVMGAYAVALALTWAWVFGPDLWRTFGPGRDREDEVEEP